MLTKPVQQIIREAIRRTESSNRYVLCAEVAEILQETYPGRKLDYQVKRMSLATSKQILSAIDNFFFAYVEVPKNNEEDTWEDFDLY